jgi:magnesium chelatase family protein
VQGERLKASGVLTNSEMGVKEIRTFCNLGEEEREFIRRASLKLNLSARAYHRVLKLSRTIADLDGSEGIRTSHVAEAIQYRTKTEWH